MVAGENDDPVLPLVEPERLVDAALTSIGCRETHLSQRDRGVAVLAAVPVDAVNKSSGDQFVGKIHPV